ncbi:MAG: helix-turn-helix transcriptional regulator [Ruminococcaceae bacterium]|nr:helix-turn-helix transcriptional regulator [Oscillospiraceae bacterium]
MYEIFAKLLQLHGVTAYRVSKETGISQTTFSAWKNGISVPKQEKLEKIADYFDVSIDYLMGRDETVSDEDLELNAYLEELRTRPEMKMLFSLTKNATKQEVERAVKVIEALLGGD